MFEKLSRAAERAAAGAGTSRRGFLAWAGRAALAGAVAAGGALASAGPAAAARRRGKPRCHCTQPFFGCKPTDQACIGYCGTQCPPGGY